MGWRIKKREDVEPLCPLKSCFCLDNRMGTFIGSITIFFTAMLEMITVVLDFFSYFTDFEFEGSFKSTWKRLYWKGFVICDGVMTVAHIIIIIIAGITAYAILKPAIYRIYRLYPILQAFYITLIIYILVELGVSCYVYSWYGLAGWRLPFLIWKNMFNIIRFFINVGFCAVIYSYFCEIHAELSDPYGDELTSKEELVNAAMGGPGDYSFNGIDSKVYEEAHYANPNNMSFA